MPVHEGYSGLTKRGRLCPPNDGTPGRLAKNVSDSQPVAPREYAGGMKRRFIVPAADARGAAKLPMFKIGA